MIVDYDYDVRMEDDRLYEWEIEDGDSEPFYCCHNCDKCWIGCGV